MNSSKTGQLAIVAALLGVLAPNRPRRGWHKSRANYGPKKKKNKCTGGQGGKRK